MLADSILTVDEPTTLECGRVVTNLQIAYKTWGALNKDRTNVILICHHLTGNHFVADDEDNKIYGWWRDLVGKNKVIDTNKYFIICSNVIGGCYGSTGPMSIDEQTNKPYNMQFPAVTIRDMVNAQEKLLRQLNIQKLAAVIGPSFGGMLAIEWGIMYPNLVEKCIALGTSFVQSQWGIAWNEISRLTIMNSEDWNGGNYVTQPQKSLSLSRYPFILSCGNHEKINLRTKNLEVIPDQIITNFFPIQKVLKYYCEPFKHDANSFLFLLNATNTHDIRRNRPNLIKNMEMSSVQFVVIGVTSDHLYFSDDLKKEVDTFPHCTYYELNSDVGHDAVIIEQEKILAILQEII